MIYVALVLALVVGYVIGLLQKGIKITHVKEWDIPKTDRKPNPTYGIPEFMDYHEKTNGMNDF